MKFAIILLSLSFSINASSQNLLTNGGFEDENICTEYHVNCAPAAWISTFNGYSNYYKDANRAYSGTHCIAIEAGHSKIPFSRTFVRSQLLCKMHKGHQYKIEFFVKSRHDILDSIGIYFTSFDFLFFKDKPYEKIIPSMYAADGSNKFVKGDTSWQKVAIDYTAKGDEQYFTLGNFSKRDITGGTGIPKENHFFVFIDDISLIPLDANEKICSDWQTTKEKIYDQHERHEYLNILIRTYAESKKFLESPELSSTSVTVIDTLVLPDVLFASGKADLEPSSYQLLDSFSKNIIGKQVDSLVVAGHTDSTGTVELNAKLSFDRAKTVVNYFIAKSLVKPEQAVTKGWGSSKPLAENQTPQGRQKNRRVEVFLYIRE